MTQDSTQPVSVSAEVVVTNEEILKALRELQHDAKIPLFTESEINTLRELIRQSTTINKMATERQAFNIVFSKGRVIMGIFAGIILSLTSFLVDWHNLKNVLLKVGG